MERDALEQPPIARPRATETISTRRFADAFLLLGAMATLGAGCAARASGPAPSDAESSRSTSNPDRAAVSLLARPCPAETNPAPTASKGDPREDAPRVFVEIVLLDVDARIASTERPSVFLVTSDPTVRIIRGIGALTTNDARTALEDSVAIGPGQTRFEVAPLLRTGGDDGHVDIEVDVAIDDFETHLSLTERQPISFALPGQTLREKQPRRTVGVATAYLVRSPGDLRRLYECKVERKRQAAPSSRSSKS